MNTGRPADTAVASTSTSKAWSAWLARTTMRSSSRYKTAQSLGPSSARRSLERGTQHNSRGWRTAPGSTARCTPGCPLSRRLAEVTVALPRYLSNPLLPSFGWRGVRAWSTRTSTENHAVADAKGVSSTRESPCRQTHDDHQHPGPLLQHRTRTTDGRGFRRYRSKQALPGNLSLSPTARTVVLQALPASPPLAESDYPGPAVAVTLDAIQGVTMPPHPHEQQRWWQPGSTTARTEHVAFTRKEYSTVR